VLSVNYRGGTGYGLNFRVPPKFGPSGASEFNDILGAASFLKARADVDAKRLGVWGGSYGGYMTALALARASDTFAAGVDCADVPPRWNDVRRPPARVPFFRKHERRSTKRQPSCPSLYICLWRSHRCFISSVRVCTARPLRSAVSRWLQRSPAPSRSPIPAS